MMETLHRFRRLAGTERTVVLEAAASILAVWIVLRLAGLRICQAIINGPRPAANPKTDHVASIEAAKRISHLEVVTARNLFFRSTCLEQSIALCWMLRRRGIAPVLRIGARKDASLFEAHSWVEINGIPVSDDGGQHAHFAPFKRADVSMEPQPR